MKVFLTTLLTLTLSTACTVLPAKQPVAHDNVEENSPDVYQQPGSAKFTAELAQQLVDNASVKLEKAQVGVTHLVGVTSQYDESSALSQVLSEQLMLELHRRNWNVMDFKTTDFLRVTSNGDFALSRDYLELDEIMPISHVVVGTLSRHRDGIMVNTRLVDINSKKVASVAQVFLPESVVRQLDENDGLPLLRKAP
jgi:TolB-like protein